MTLSLILRSVLELVHVYEGKSAIWQMPMDRSSFIFLIASEHAQMQQYIPEAAYSRMIYQISFSQTAVCVIIQWIICKPMGFERSY